MPRPRPPRRSAGPGGSAPSGGARRFPPETILEAVRALDSGVPAPVVCRRFGVSDRTLYRWRRDATPRVKRPA